MSLFVNLFVCLFMKPELECLRTNKSNFLHSYPQFYCASKNVNFQTYGRATIEMASITIYSSKYGFRFAVTFQAFNIVAKRIIRKYELIMNTYETFSGSIL